MLRICGCVYKTCHWLAGTKDVASSYHKNVGFTLREEGERATSHWVFFLVVAWQNDPKVWFWLDRLWFLADKSGVFKLGQAINELVPLQFPQQSYSGNLDDFRQHWKNPLLLTSLGHTREFQASFTLSSASFLKWEPQGHFIWANIWPWLL